MGPQELQALIRTGIPVANFMQLSVLEVRPDGVDLSAPLAPNLNVHGTLFGGSGAAMALVAAWSLSHTRLHREGLDVPLVVVKQNMQYFKPVRSTVIARARFAPGHGWEPFILAVQQSQRARLGVVVELVPESKPEEVAARLEATFAAVPG
jgi:thioesterase domain-containing protein